MNDAYKRGYALIDWSVPIPKAAPKPRSGNARGAFPCPMIASDELPPGTYSGADGKAYSSKAALRASYLPGGNPKGVRYEEIGNETQKWTAPASDKAAIRETVRKAISEVKERNL